MSTRHKKVDSPFRNANTPWVCFADGFYRLFNGTLQYAPEDAVGGFAITSDRCDVDFYSIDPEAVEHCEMVRSILREEPFCVDCENPGSMCACEPHGRFL